MAPKTPEKVMIISPITGRLTEIHLTTAQAIAEHQTDQTPPTEEQEMRENFNRECWING